MCVCAEEHVGDKMYFIDQREEWGGTAQTHALIQMTRIKIKVRT